MADSQRSPSTSEFHALVLPHRDAAYNLALWIVASPADAEDVAQEALVRAWRAMPQFRGGSARSWLLQIVRNVAYTHLERSKRSSNVVTLEDATRRRDQKARGHELADDAPNAEAQLVKADEQAALGAALAKLPLHLRETLVLREMEDLTYQEIASVMAVPVGTVMSRLARAREQLRRAFTAQTTGGDRNRAL